MAEKPAYRTVETVVRGERLFIDSAPGRLRVRGRKAGQPVIFLAFYREAPGSYLLDALAGPNLRWQKSKATRADAIKWLRPLQLSPEAVKRLVKELARGR